MTYLYSKNDVFIKLFLVLNTVFIAICSADDIMGCQGFIKSHVPLDYSKIEIGLYTKGGILKLKTECAPTNGYYFLPLYEKGEYVLKVNPPPGWSFEPSEKELLVDGVNDLCSLGQDINFSFNGFGIAGRVITAGQKQGPSGVAVQLINDKGDVRNTVTTVDGDFTFTPVIPGKYTVKATHPKWKLDPAEAVVQVKEGNTALPVGVLAVKGYDVKGTITAFGQPSVGVYVMLYSKQSKQKLKVEECNTALLQGVPDAPICHVTTDSSGQFTFGLVPAGQYKLVVVKMTPGQTAQTYNIKPDEVSFEVKHDSLFIKDAFEVTGYDLIGTTTADKDFRIPSAQILMDNVPVTKSDINGRFTLTGLQPGTYTVSAKHEHCEFASVQLKVASYGALNPVFLRVSAWQACGQVTPPPPSRTVLFSGGELLTATVDDEGKWCRFLPLGAYEASVQTSDQDKQGGLQYFPLSQKVFVSRDVITDLQFSQLKGTVQGSVRCLLPADCQGMEVTVVVGDAGQGGTYTTTVQDGVYSVEDIPPGAVRASVPEGRWCWRRRAASLVLQQRQVQVPAFEQTAYALHVHSKYQIQVKYRSGAHSGTLEVPAGWSRHCLPSPGTYSLTPEGCHKHQPDEYTVDLAADRPTVEFKAVSHANEVVILSPVPAPDLVLSVQVGGTTSKVGPLAGEKISEKQYKYTHTLYLPDGGEAVVSASSSQLVPIPPQLVTGTSSCAAPAVTVVGRRGVVWRGRVVPPVEGVRVTLTGEDIKLTHTTGPDGSYEFGPLDAALQYRVTAEKESYVFGDRDEEGNIAASKLGEIHVTLVDDRDGSPLQGAVVSVSGGSYRRTQAAGAAGALSFSSLAAALYYVKPLLAEYRFHPPHATVQLPAAADHTVTLKGTRVAWSCVGRVVSAAGAAWPRVTVAAAPAPAPHASAPAPAACSPLHANTDQHGHFRIRGLLPECWYRLQLKTSDAPELRGLRIVKDPGLIQVKDQKDVTDVVVVAVQPQPLTDGSALVLSPLQHYKTLRLTLSADDGSSAPLFSARLDAAGYSEVNNPGLVYPLPRLPSDNSTYVLKLESTLSKSTHSYEEQAVYFTADGSYKHFTFEFAPKVKSSEQELKHTPIGVVPLIVAGAVAYWQRGRISARL